MFCFIELVLMVFGINLARKASIRYGGEVALAPYPQIAGAVLILALPLTTATGFTFGVIEGYQAAKKGKHFDQRHFAAKYAWIDIAIPTGCCVLSGLILYSGLGPIKRRGLSLEEEIALTEAKLSSMKTIEKFPEQHHYGTTNGQRY